jgi:hypothetical protein
MNLTSNDNLAAIVEEDEFLEQHSEIEPSHKFQRQQANQIVDSFYIKKFDQQRRNNLAGDRNSSSRPNATPHPK